MAAADNGGFQMTVMVDDRRALGVAPERSQVQRMDALRSANRIRTYRAQMKVQIKVRPAIAAEVLAETPSMVESMKVFDLLMAVPKFGRTKVGVLLRRESISPSKTVGGLSKRQRQALLLALAVRGVRS